MTDQKNDLYFFMSLAKIINRANKNWAHLNKVCMYFQDYSYQKKFCSQTNIVRRKNYLEIFD